jgi:hypothetical protein
MELLISALGYALSLDSIQRTAAKSAEQTLADMPPKDLIIFM